MRSYGDQGGAAYDDWCKVISALMVSASLTWEQADTELEKVKGDKRHAYLVNSSTKDVNLLLGTPERTHRADEFLDLLVQSATNIDPRFVIDDWIEKVMAATGSVNRRQKSIAACRSVDFHVRSRDDYLTLKRELSGRVLPPQPPSGTSEETKNDWRTTCAARKVNYIQNAGMVHTVQYFHWKIDHR